MSKEQILIGGVTSALCLLGIAHSRWMLRETRKGQLLVRWFGEDRAIWILRGLLIAGIVFGVLLAMNIIRPIQW